MKQRAQQEKEADGRKEEEEEKETEMASARRKKLLQKLEKRKMQRCLNQFSGWSSTGYDMSAVYELKLRKLKANNRALAKALADQKLETQQWYREVITLKSELQEIQERLLRTTNDDFEAAVEYEVEKRLREQCEPINAAISTAMENVVVVVESLTKAKQITGGVLKSCHKRSSCSSRNSSSANSFPRTSGSRLPLGPSSSNEPPRLSVLPMVSGHVLQPAMVAIPKLDVIWSRKVKERIQAHAEEGLDMSTIGEQSSTIEDEERSPSQRGNEAETTKEESNTSSEAEEGSDSSDSQPDPSIPADDTEVKMEGSTLAVQSRASTRTRTSITGTEALEPKSMTPGCSRKTESQRQGKPSKGAKAVMNRVAGESPATSRAESPLASSVQEDVEMKQEKRVPSVKQTVPESEEDPLEGPSWWYPDVSKKRSSNRSRGYAKSARQRRQKTSVECPSWQSHGHMGLESSSDSENDSLDKVSKSIKSAPGKAPKEPSQSATPAKASPKDTLDHSYLASPTTMLARLEDLEARAGRRSKSRSKGQSLRTSTGTLRRVSEINSANQRRRTRRSRELSRGTDEVACVENTSESCTLRLSETDTDTDSQTSNESHHKDAILMPPPSRIRPDQRIDFLITDNDLTCVHDVSMEMTEPLSKIISQAIAEAPKEDEKNKKEEKDKQTQSERRFFKAQSPEPSQVEPVVSEKTPFDVSLMDATVVDIPPYSSKKTIEKENLPPQSDNYIDGKESQRSLSLRRLSIVLQDVMKSPDTLKKFTVTANVSLSSGSENSGNVSGRSSRNKSHQQSIMESPKKKKNIKRRNLKFSLKDTQEEGEEEEEEDELWTPPYVKKKKTSNRKTGSTGKIQTRKSGAGRKRLSAVDTATEPLKKKHQKKTNESDIETSVRAADSSLSIQDDGSEDCFNKVTQQGKERNGTKGKNLESESASSSSVNECSVKVQRTNLQDIKESVDNPEESSIHQLDDSLINVSPMLPLKFNKQEDLSKQMENVMKKALQMRMEQSDISGNGLELSTDKEQLEKQSDDEEEGVQDDKEKNNEVSQCEKNGRSEQEEKDHLQVEEKENMQEEKDHPQVEEKEDMQKEEQYDSVPQMPHSEAQEEPQPENIQKNYQNNIEQEGKQAETREEDTSDNIQQEERHETLEEEFCDVAQQRVQEEKEQEEGQIKKGSETVVVVPCDKEDQEEENIVNNSLKGSSNDVRGSSKKEDNEDCIQETPTRNQKGIDIGNKKEGGLEDIAEVEQPRKRRAALKVTSFKELSLNSKLRQIDGSMVVVSSTSNVKRKSGRRSTMECT